MKMTVKGWLYVSCVLIFVLEAVFLMALGYGHPHFPFEKVPGFGCILGFVGAGLIVLIAKLLSKILSKKEDYYAE